MQVKSLKYLILSIISFVSILLMTVLNQFFVLLYVGLPWIALASWASVTFFIAILLYVPDSFLSLMTVMAAIIATTIVSIVIVGLRLWRSKERLHQRHPWYRQVAFWIAAIVGLAITASVGSSLNLCAADECSDNRSAQRHRLAFASFRIESRSALPTLQNGDVVMGALLNRSASRPVVPGDVLMVTWSVGAKQEMIVARRVVALGGSTVEMRSGLLYIDGAPIHRELVEDSIVQESVNGFPVEDVELWRETLPNGRSYLIYQRKDDHLSLDVPPFKVPEGEFYALGDNRSNSIDSRFRKEFGALAGDRLRYRVLGITWSRDLSRIGRQIE